MSNLPIFFTCTHEEHPTKCPSKIVFLINFQVAGKFFKLNSWLGKYKEQIIKIIKLLSIKSEILFYSCRTLCLFNSQIITFPHKLSFLM